MANQTAQVFSRQPDRIWLEELKLSQFRNYVSARVELDGRHVVLTGQNGAGKTNLLEAVSFLSPGRGMRRAAYSQVANTKSSDEGSWAVHTQLHGAIGEVSIGTGISITPQGLDSQRRVRVNSANAKSSDELLDHARVLWLTPAMDGLFTGGKSDRRRFLDRMVLAIDPEHGRRVNAFEKAMRSRNKLLETASNDDAWLGGIEQQMAEYCVAIAFARAELVNLLKALIDGEVDTSFPKANLALAGDLEDLMRAGSASDLEDSFRSELARARMRDRAAGRTLIGPHRTDLLVRHSAKDMEAALCSTGEQKGLLTGLVLAHAKLVGEVSGMAPILLLDEIAAHFDGARREALFDLIDTLGCQAWMTGTDDHLFEALANRAQYFHVSDGTVTVHEPETGGAE